MKNQRVFSFKPALILTAAVVLLTGITFGQGKGKGHGNGDGHGRRGEQRQGDQENRGGGRPAERGFSQVQSQPDFRGRGNGNGRFERSNRQEIRPQRNGRVEYLGPPIVQPSRGGQGDNRGRGHDKKEKREYERQERQVRIFDPRWNDDQRIRAVRREVNDRRDRDQKYPQYLPQPRWYENYGAYRSAQVHERNDRRKAEREARKARAVSYDRDSRYYGRDTYYREPYRAARNYFGYSDDWRDRLLRTVIGNVFNSSDPYGKTYQCYQSQTVYRQVYQPAYYEPTYYPSADNNYRYSPVYVDDPYNSDDIVSNLGFGDSDFGGIVTRIFSELLAVGYDDGYQAGRYARSRGYRDDRNYSDPYDPYDPYVYDDVSFNNIDYNPYSSLAENRRYLSEGYELGYKDGLHDAGGRGGFNEAGNGSLDLVSILLGNIL